MSEYDERRGPTEQFQVDDAPRRPGSPTPSAKIRAVARYERIQLVIRVITLLFSYSVLALWIYVAIKWNDTAGSTFRSVVVDPLQEVNMWFGIPIVCVCRLVTFEPRSCLEIPMIIILMRKPRQSSPLASIRGISSRFPTLFELEPVLESSSHTNSSTF